MEKEGRLGVWLLVAALVAFAALIAPNVFARAGETMIPTARPAGENAGDDSLSAAASPTPDPPEDATGRAFDTVRAGDCLSVYDTGTGAWSASRPERVDCAADNAYVRVSAVEMQAADCPQGAGQSFWGYARGVHTVALCLTRRFEVGTCLLADETQGSGGEGETEMQAGLLTVVDCEDGEIPEGYNRVLSITGVYDTPEELSGPLCARGPQDDTSYWYWFVENAEEEAADESGRPRDAEGAAFTAPLAPGEAGDAEAGADGESAEPAGSTGERPGTLLCTTVVR